jgi:hypothetical protein
LEWDNIRKLMIPDIGVMAQKNVVAFARCTLDVEPCIGREIGMDTQVWLCRQETELARAGASWPSDIAAGWHERRADLLFASEVLRSLRRGSAPSPRALECSGFVEHWMVATQDDVYLLIGTVWRLPLSRNALATPLLAIDPVAGWARVVGEWLTIETPCLDLATAGIDPERVADRAARWLERKLGAGDSDMDCKRRN